MIPTAPLNAPRALLLAALALIAARLAFWFGAPPNSDEAYYWLWGAHPALSYFDHPPLHAWIQGAARAALGTSRFSLRLAPALSTVASALLVARLVRRIGAPAGAGGATAAVLAALATPLLLLFTSFAWMDHLLILFSLLAIERFGAFYGDVAAGRPGLTATLLAGALALGLAALSKYNAAFLGLALAGVAAWDPRLRGLYRQPRFWLAAVLAVTVLAPVLAWNAAHGMASFRFHLVERHVGVEGVRWSVAGPFRFLLPFLVLASPWLLAAVLGALRRSAQAPAVEVHRKLAVLGFALPTAAFLAVGTLSTALYYWNLVGLVPLLPFAGALAARPRLFAGHLVFGVAVAALLAVHGTVVPFSALVPGVEDDESRNPWGWREIAMTVQALRASRPGSFAAASDYRSGAALGFALLEAGTPDAEAEVVVLSPRRSAFDDWRDDADLSGRDAVLVTDRQAEMWPGLAAAFANVAPTGEVRVARLGVPLKPWQLWRCSGYRTPPFAAPSASR